MKPDQLGSNLNARKFSQAHSLARSSHSSTKELTSAISSLVLGHSKADEIAPEIRDVADKALRNSGPPNITIQSIPQLDGV